MGVEESKMSKIEEKQKHHHQQKIEKKPTKEKEIQQKSEHQGTIKKKEEEKPTSSSISGSLLQDIRKVYRFKDVLGGGHFGQVRLGYRKDEEPRKYYAIKSIQLKNLSKKDLEDLGREVDIISGLDHPNIIKFYETYHDKFYFHIVMELCTGKEVFDRIVEEGKITEQKVANIIRQVLQAVAYIHSKGITHRDLKPENIMFQTTNPSGEVKLIDFGLSRKYLTNEKMHTVLGTPYYVAPEVLKGEYDERCDIWSIGSIAYILLSGIPPFNGTNNNEIFVKIINEKLAFPPEKFQQISKEAIDFINQCLIKDPTKRPNAKMALNHSWFKRILVETQKEEFLCSDILINLRNFSSPQKFKKIILKFLMEQLSSKELSKLKNAFTAIDTNHSGHIDMSELDKAFKMANIEISSSELNTIISRAENDQLDGKLNYSEFLVACMNQKKHIDKEKLIQAFKYFDIDDSGFIDASDLKNALLRSGKQIVSEKEVDALISEVNTSKDKKISLENFLQMFDIKPDS